MLLASGDRKDEKSVRHLSIFGSIFQPQFNFVYHSTEGLTISVYLTTFHCFVIHLCVPFWTRSSTKKIEMSRYY